MFYNYKCISFHVFGAGVQITTVCRIFTPCSALRLLRRFEVTYCLSLCMRELCEEKAEFLQD